MQRHPYVHVKIQYRINTSNYTFSAPTFRLRKTDFPIVNLRNCNVDLLRYWPSFGENGHVKLAGLRINAAKGSMHRDVRA